MSTSPSDALTVAADYFDGLSTRPHRVTLTLSGDALVLDGETVMRREPLAALRISEPLGAAPRLITFPDGAHCEVRDHQKLGALLRASGYRDSWVVHLQEYWRAAAASVAITVAVLAAGYVWGLPALAGALADRMPEAALVQLGSGTLQVLDRAVLEPTQLPQPRQRALQTRFDRLVSPPGGIRATHHVVFRKGSGIGANALALPDGTIVLTDELVTLAEDDEEILAVLAHELGHLERRHSLRMLIQGSLVAFIVSWYAGDVSNVAAGLPTLLLQARYSREHESEADRFAAAMLRANGIPPQRLGDMLRRLEAAHAKRAGGDGTQDSSARGKDYLSSHPATAERIRALQAP